MESRSPSVFTELPWPIGVKQAVRRCHNGSKQDRYWRPLRSCIQHTTQSEALCGCFARGCWSSTLTPNLSPHRAMEHPKRSCDRLASADERCIQDAFMTEQLCVLFKNSDFASAWFHSKLQVRVLRVKSSCLLLSQLLSARSMHDQCNELACADCEHTSKLKDGLQGHDASAFAAGSSEDSRAQQAAVCLEHPLQSFP